MSTPYPTTDRSGRHPVNVGHLVMGMAFAGFVVIWALVASDTVTGSNVRYLMPLPWVAAGLAGLLASFVSRRRASAGRASHEHSDTKEF